jgi:hypothetical protein
LAKKGYNLKQTIHSPEVPQTKIEPQV